jgi:phosphoglycolate phosphatase
MLDVHDLHGCFITIQTADTSPSKPHPDMIVRALRETGAEAIKTVMIGDTGFDMSMARSAGVHAIGVTWGYHDHSQLVTEGAERIVDTFDELLLAINEVLEIAKEAV